MKWFKMDSAIYENAKVQSLDLPVLKTWLNLLGVYARYEGFPSIKQIAYITRQSLDDLNYHIASLISDGLIDKDSEGNIEPHDWAQHNPYDLSTERVQKHRATKREKQNETVSKPVKQVKHVSSVSSVSNVSSVSSEIEPNSGAIGKEREISGNGELYSKEKTQVVENKHSTNGVAPLEDLDETVKRMKRLRVEESRREEIRKEENTLSHLSSLSPAVVGLTEPQNGASAILNSSQNGKAHEPSEPELDAFSIWAHAVYQRHPKQKNLHDTLWTLKQKFANRPDDQKLLDENHPLWIAYWQLDPSYPRFVPGLADRDGRGWLNDQVWRKPPPPPPSTKTKLQMADDAIFQKLLAEAEVNDKKRENRK